MNHECAISISHDNVNRRVLFCFVLLDTAEDQFPYNYFRWRVLDEWKRLYGCGGGKIVHCAEPASKCRSACAGHSGQKLLPVVVRKCGDQQLGLVYYDSLCVRHGSITSALLNDDKMGQGDYGGRLLDCLGLRLGVCCHVIIT